MTTRQSSEAATRASASSGLSDADASARLDREGPNLLPSPRRPPTCLDIGTDLLPAPALGVEAPNTQALARPPMGRHLIDRPLLRRVFCVLGPAEAVMEMTAFIVALMAAGWTPGDSFPTGHALAAASGAAFAAVVIGQMANAFACRSATRWPGALGWTGNRLLLGAVAAEVCFLGAFLLIHPIASILDHAAPPLAGLDVAALTAPAVLLADALHKRARARTRAAPFL